MHVTIPALFHWRPPHDPWTFTGDGCHAERLTKRDRRRLKKRTRRLTDQMFTADWEENT